MIRRFLRRRRLRNKCYREIVTKRELLRISLKDYEYRTNSRKIASLFGYAEKGREKSCESARNRNAEKSVESKLKKRYWRRSPTSGRISAMKPLLFM